MIDLTGAGTGTEERTGHARVAVAPGLERVVGRDRRTNAPISHDGRFDVGNARDSIAAIGISVPPIGDLIEWHATGIAAISAPGVVRAVSRCEGNAGGLCPCQDGRVVVAVAAAIGSAVERVLLGENERVCPAAKTGLVIGDLTNSRAAKIPA